MKLRMLCLIPLLAHAAPAATPSVLIRVTMDENTPKVGEEYAVTQKVPMKAGEMAVVLAHCEDAYPETYRRFIPKGTPPEQVTHWIDTLGATGLLQGTEPKKMKATPGRGGPPFEFTLRAADECALHIAAVEGTLEVMVRSSKPISYFLLMGKTPVEPAKPLAAGQVEAGDPFFETSFQYKAHPYPGKPGKGVVFELTHPDADPKTDSQAIAVLTPAGALLDVHNVLNDTSGRIFIGSMSAHDYQVQARQLSRPGESAALVPLRYELTAREVPDLLELLGLAEVAP